MGKQVLCSIWDQHSGKASVTQCGKGVNCQSFGGEGTGSKATWTGLTMTLGRTYAFAWHRDSLGSGEVQHTCYFQADELKGTHEGGWKHIATFKSGMNRH